MLLSCCKTSLQEYCVLHMPVRQAFPNRPGPAKPGQAIGVPDRDHQVSRPANRRQVERVLCEDGPFGGCGSSACKYSENPESNTGCPRPSPTRRARENHAGRHSKDRVARSAIPLCDEVNMMALDPQHVALRADPAPGSPASLAGPTCADGLVGADRQQPLRRSCKLVVGTSHLYSTRLPSPDCSYHT